MTLDTITMDRTAAKQAYHDYQAAVRANRTGIRSHWRKEDEALAQGYRALSKGQQLLNVRLAMQAAGLRPDGYPRLAICRSDAVRCRVAIHSATVTFGPEVGSGRWGRWRKREAVEIPMTGTDYRHPDKATLVPIIPPALRPKVNLTHFHTLWEVDQWQPSSAPGDPALLRHLGGELYVVVAVWDLTDLERAVLGGRAR